MTRTSVLLGALVTALLWPQFVAAQTAPAAPAAEHVHPSPDERAALPPAAGEPQAPPDDLPSFIPRLTDADRQAAFPDLGGHAASNPVRAFVLVDRFEWQASERANAVDLNVLGWVGGDRDRLWFRGEGGGQDGDLDEAEAHLLWGRHVARWWDVVGGIRQDAGGPGSSQTWAAIGVQGLAPHWFELDATAYVGGSGRTRFRVDVGYEVLVTNRWIVQPHLEANFAAKADPERQTGAGLMTTEVGLRLRYEVRRELAPYAGIVWRNKWQGTADLARAAGDEDDGARVVAGLRFWW
jgi:copper resistance protein B